MKTKLLIILSAGLFTLSVKSQINQRTCGTLILSQQFELQVQKWIANLSQQKTQAINFTLPVVVHVVHDGQAVGTGPNISNAQIVSQMTVLNQDFAGLNADSILIPGTFKPDFAHCGISFCLAKTDTSGNAMAEIGVDRIDRNSKGWKLGPYLKSFIDDTLKPQSIWNPNKYLNLWALDLGGGLLGYATFPDPAATGLGGLTGYDPSLSDGVVIATTAFGNIGTLNASYDKGRTATHEVGHWLGLRHIWGDGSCATDYVNDTPDAQAANYGCKTHPYNVGGCVGNSTGEMFMNYMDYGNDTCLQMFSNGQKTRMVAILNGSPIRMNLAASNKCNLTGIESYNLQESEFSVFPNPNNGEFVLKSNAFYKSLTITVINILGEKIYEEKNLNSNSIKINLNDKNAGVYFIYLTGDKFGIVKKMILSK